MNTIFSEFFFPFLILFCFEGLHHIFFLSTISLKLALQGHGLLQQQWIGENIFKVHFYLLHTFTPRWKSSFSLLTYIFFFSLYQSHTRTLLSFLSLIFHSLNLLLFSSFLSLFFSFSRILKFYFWTFSRLHLSPLCSRPSWKDIHTRLQNVHARAHTHTHIHARTHAFFRIERLVFGHCSYANGFDVFEGHCFKKEREKAALQGRFSPLKRKWEICVSGHVCVCVSVSGRVCTCDKRREKSNLRNVPACTIRNFFFV